MRYALWLVVLVKLLLAAVAGLSDRRRLVAAPGQSGAAKTSPSTAVVVTYDAQPTPDCRRYHASRSSASRRRRRH